MRKMTFAKRIFWISMLSLFFLSCEDKMLEHYEVPDWIAGNTFETLEGRGNYSIFLKGVEISGYKPIVDGKNILTVMAPNDEAFEKYFASKGVSKLEDLGETEITKLITFHLMYYSYNTSKLINFRPEGDGVTEEEAAIKAGLYYKFRTKSYDFPTQELDPATGNYVTVYHLERFLPVFSYKFFETKGIDPVYNYEYFYPNSSWTGNNGFNVSNASVTEYELISSNGYIYLIDQVLEPLETIYTELKKRESEYSIFYELYDSYSTYEYDATLSKNYGEAAGVDSLYLHLHSDNLPNIASEWPVTDYTKISTLASESYSVFAPSNNALTRFFDEYWAPGGYSSLNEVDPLVMSYLLNQHVYSGSVVFPEEIVQEKIKTVYGTIVNINPDNVKDRIMCVNGSFFGIEEMTAPAIFAATSGPAFQYAKYRNYLYMLNGSGLLTSMASNDVRFTALMPTNQQIENDGMLLRETPEGLKLQEIGDEGTYVDVSDSKMSSIVNLHLSNEGIQLNTTGTQVITTQTAFNYWYVKDGKITTSNLFNQYLNPEYIGDPFVTFNEVKFNGSDWSNGYVYSYDNNNLFTPTESGSYGLEYNLAISNDKRYEYYLFSQLLSKAGVVNGENISFIMGVSRFITFIPTNSAIENAIAAGRIPGITNGYIDSNGNIQGTIDATALRLYMGSYFITSLNNAIGAYPYPGSTFRNGEYLSWGNYNLQITDNGSEISVQMVGRTASPVKVVDTYNQFPFAYTDGCFHFIEAIL